MTNIARLQKPRLSASAVQAVSPILTITGKTREQILTARSGFADGQLNFNRSALLQLLSDLLAGQIVVTNPNRRITVSADIYVEDDETFGANETARRQQTNAAILSTQGIAQNIMNFEVRMGGEIRLEFVVNASLMDSNGNAMLDGDLKLFEGTSESTNDLDGVRQFQLYIPAGATVNHFVRINNDDEGGDYATVRLNITNTGV